MPGLKHLSILVFVLVMFVTSCHMSHRGLQLFAETNPELSPEYWAGWTVVLHPDNGYRWIECKNEAQRIYVDRKGTQIWVKYFSDGSWNKKALSELPGINCNNKVISDEEFRSRVEWLLTNDIVYLSGDSTCLKIQSKTFAIQLVAHENQIDWQDWNGCWSR